MIVASGADCKKRMIMIRRGHSRLKDFEGGNLGRDAMLAPGENPCIDTRTLTTVRV